MLAQKDRYHQKKLYSATLVFLLNLKNITNQTKLITWFSYYQRYWFLV